MMEESLPPYTYTPGATPHPISDPRGHAFGRPPAPLGAVDPGRLEGCPAFLRACELFRKGYYWEAHEEWEQIWQALGRTGPAADFLKGLIKLAAAGVKRREGNRDGVQRHARRAAELFRSVALATAGDQVAGASLKSLLEFADGLAAEEGGLVPLGHGLAVVFWPLLPGEPGGL